jgi:hypothetical protein
VKELLHYILSNKGQKIVHRVGQYLPLTIEAALNSCSNSNETQSWSPRRAGRVAASLALLARRNRACEFPRIRREQYKMVGLCGATPDFSVSVQLSAHFAACIRRCIGVGGEKQ